MKFIAPSLAIALALATSGLALAQTPPTIVVPNQSAPKTVDVQNGFPNRNGPFSAMMVVIPSSEMAEFSKPSNEGLSLSEVTSAETGAELAIKLLFNGMVLDGDQTADVTYDLLIKAPNGKTYGHSDFHGLTGIKGKVAEPNAVFDNGPEVVHLVFEDTDPMGIYSLYATITDNVSKRSVPVKLTLTHIPKGGAAVVKPLPAKQKVKKRSKRRR